MRFSLLSSYTYTPNELLASLPTSRSQVTLAKEFFFEGVGLFTGTSTSLRIYPAPAGHGIVFKRVDLEGAPEIPALIEFVDDTPRCTILRHGNAQVQTVEHLLSALKAFDIDNALIEINGPEIPAGDGSALPFVGKILEAGIRIQKEAIQVKSLARPVYWTKGDIHIVAVPCEEYKVSYTLSYPGHPLLDAQFYSGVMTEEEYKKEIAPCRTFSLYEEITPLLEKGLIKGGSLDNGVVIKGRQVMNPEGLRFPNEMVRHKVLDLIGDLSLIGFPFTAHVIAIRSGHFANGQFARELRQYFDQLEFE